MFDNAIVLFLCLIDTSFVERLEIGNESDKRSKFHSYSNRRCSAGCLLANRLSARPNNRILLIEAGGWNNGFWLKLPVGYYKTMNNPDVSRHFATEPSTGFDGRVVNWPRGRVIGLSLIHI